MSLADTRWAWAAGARQNSRRAASGQCMSKRGGIGHIGNEATGRVAAGDGRRQAAGSD